MIVDDSPLNFGWYTSTWCIIEQVIELVDYFYSTQASPLGHIVGQIIELVH